MIKDKYGDKLDGWIHTFFPFLFEREINPDLLTLLGSGICVAAAVAFGMGHFLFGGALLLVGGFCDLVDGVVARHFDRSTVFGAFLDSTLDRFVDMVVMLALVIYYAGLGDVATAVVAGIVMIASVLTSYTKARAEGLDLNLEGGIMERGERVGVLLLGAFTGLMVPALWLLAVGSTATVIQRFTNARRGLEQVDDARSGRQRTTEQLVHGE